VSAGARLLLIDEDTSAANFLARGERMRALVPDDPIRPLVDHVRELFDDHGVSTVIVTGSSSAFLSVADCVIRMDHFEPKDVTEDAWEIAPPPPVVSPSLPSFEDRRQLTEGNFDPAYRAGRLNKTVAVRIKPLRGRPKMLEYGDDVIDLEAQDALVDAGQVAAIGRALLKGRDMIGHDGPSPTVLAWRLDAMRVQHLHLDSRLNTVTNIVRSEKDTAVGAFVYLEVEIEDEI